MFTRMIFSLVAFAVDSIYIHLFIQTFKIHSVLFHLGFHHCWSHTKSLLLLLTIIALWRYLGNIVINALTSQFLIMNIIASNHYKQVRTTQNYHGYGLHFPCMAREFVLFSLSRSVLIITLLFELILSHFLNGRHVYMKPFHEVLTK